MRESFFRVLKISIELSYTLYVFNVEEWENMDEKTCSYIFFLL